MFKLSLKLLYLVLIEVRNHMLRRLRRALRYWAISLPHKEPHQVEEHNVIARCWTHMRSNNSIIEIRRKPLPKLYLYLLLFTPGILSCGCRFLPVPVSGWRFIAPRGDLGFEPITKSKRVRFPALWACVAVCCSDRSFWCSASRRFLGNNAARRIEFDRVEDCVYRIEQRWILYVLPS